MDSDILVGAASVAVAAVLLWIGMPDKSGISPRFLRFEIAPLIYPAVILAIFAIGSRQPGQRNCTELITRRGRRYDQTSSPISALVAAASLL